ncbi:PEP-CTERM sorting domain-containing protein [Aliiglaciecola lipolytica]|uniref:PEP-CTERM sorting domain-containing protein n=1 Tax=Aliiglaciecola lipolytica TaxID=477689 RepID=UPI001C09C610|nr:PEP-CTERM sorting domain-containing protein [Aliiglaciecola lipolytica]MBU2880130.1 PEP-CTERM sorting domain-containing protein [Aliiglaciecola lipolytica]
MKLRAFFMIFSFFVLGLQSANATLINYDIQVSSTDWFDHNGTPFSMTLSPTLLGSITVDNAYSNIDGLVSFDLLTGTKLWTEAELNNSVFSPTLSFNLLGDLTYFSLGFGDGSNYLIISNNNTLSVTDSSSNTSNACNGCVSIVLSHTQPNSVPEPSTLAIFSLALMSLAFRRYKKQA